MRRLGVVGISLLGLMALLQGAGSLISLFWVFGGEGDPEGLALAIASGFTPGVLLILIGVLLITYRDRLAARWFSDEPLGIAVDPESLLRIGIMLLGMYVAIFAASGLIASILEPILSWVQDRLILGEGFTQSRTIWAVGPYIAAAALRLAVGLVLVWFSGPLSAWLWTHERAVRAVSSGGDMSACPACGLPYHPEDYVPGSDARCVECGQRLSIDGA